MKVLEAIYAEISSIGKIAQECGMHRESVKIILKSLEEDGFIARETRGNRIYYHAGERDAVRDRCIQALEEQKKDIPMLIADYEDTKDTQIVNTVYGRLGLRTVLMDEIIKGKMIVGWKLMPVRNEYEPEFTANNKRRLQRGIPMRLISNSRLHTPLAQIKATHRKGKADVFVYANKVSIFYDNKKGQIFTIKIPGIARAFREIFDREWADTGPFPKKASL